MIAAYLCLSATVKQMDRHADTSTMAKTFEALHAVARKKRLSVK